MPQDHELDEAMDNELIDMSRPAIEQKREGDDQQVDPEHQSHRGHDAVERDRQAVRREGLPEDTIHIKFKGHRRAIAWALAGAGRDD